MAELAIRLARFGSAEVWAFYDDITGVVDRIESRAPARTQAYRISVDGVALLTQTFNAGTRTARPVGLLYRNLADAEGPSQGFVFETRN